jgi:RimJ/RimL family protein N-acetyltransferase
MTIELRDFAEADADTLYEWMRDPVSVRMAAFTAQDPDDREAFDAWLARVRANPTVIQKMIWVDGSLVGSISTFEMEGEREVSYWLDRAVWGQGIASGALAALLEVDTQRPLSARAATANAASAAVLERAGFVEVGRDTGFANGVGAEVEEIIFRLD